MTPPEGVKVTDTPNDAGKSVSITWGRMAYDTESVTYYVYISDREQGPFVEAASFLANTHYKKDRNWPFWCWDKTDLYHYVKIDNIKNTAKLLKEMSSRCDDLLEKNKVAEELSNQIIIRAKEVLSTSESFKGRFKEFQTDINQLNKILAEQKGYLGQWNAQVNKGFSARVKNILGKEIGESATLLSENQKVLQEAVKALKVIDLKDTASVEAGRTKLTEINFEQVSTRIKETGPQLTNISQVSKAHWENMTPEYYFKLAVGDGVTTLESPVLSAIPAGNYFNLIKLNNFALMILFSFIIVLYIKQAKRKDVFLRRIPGLDAVDEAIGRATEMGKPIFFLTGRLPMSYISTIAATTILGEIAKRIAAYKTPLRVPHTDVIVMAVCQEIVREAYIQSGHPDAYSDDINFFVTEDQFGYAAAVDGMMIREKPAACFFMGYYYAESLLLAETGASTGAIQIAGTDAEHQLPFFITACDYTLIGEELYAASAYLSREPVLVGTLRGQDFGKAILIVFIIIGVTIATLDILGVIKFPQFVELFKDF